VLGHWLFAQFMDPNGGWTWVLSIMFLTVVVRSAMIPLFVRQINSQRKMQLVGPKMKELQKKYGHDRERLAQEQMAMYKEEGINPMASCFPLLIQMPIFIALFTVLRGASNGEAIGGWLKDRPEVISSLQNAKIFGANISGTFWPVDQFGGVQILALILIVLMVGVLFITQLQMMSKNMPPEAMEGPMAQQQRMMLVLFPIMFAIGGVSMPIGVLIYWFLSNTWTLAQQSLLIHNNPAPGTPAYLDWEDRMRAKGKDPEALAAARSGKVKSKKKTETTTSGSGVVRQGRSSGQGSTRPSSAKKSPSSSNTTAESDDSAAVASSEAATEETDGGNGRQQVKRQQPSRQSRAKRKPNPGPRPAGSNNP
jgi:YidC/Oxa1 family membrane protein insertase